MLRTTSLSDLDRICQPPSNLFLEDLLGSIARHKMRLGGRPLILLACLERYYYINGEPNA